MKGFHKGLRRLCAVIIGMVFFLAGTLKLMDPVGAGLVVTEYLKFLHLRFLIGASKFAGISLALLETLTGAALVTGVWRRLAGMVCGFMLSFFTVLTFVLWLKNPPMDCGCFGEAIHLTHAQSLIKNLALMALWVVAFVPFHDFGRTRKLGSVAFAIAAVSTVLFTLYSTLSIPLIDFTDYAPGAEIYAETGLEEDDPQWDLSENLAVSLPFSNASGEYCDSLACGRSVAVVSVYDPARINGEGWEKISEFLDRAADQDGCTPLLLVASTPSALETMVPGKVLLRSFYADRKTLMTLNRSNGGVTYLGDGQIVAKWSFRTMPSRDDLTRLTSSLPTESMIRWSSRGRVRMQAYLLYVTAAMLLL